MYRSLNAASTESFVADELRSRILSGHLRPGDRLRQMSIAADLRVSSTPVREALRFLAAEGLVEIDQNRGAVVRVLSVAELIEVYELSLRIETYTAERSVPHLDEATLDQAAELEQRMRDTADLTEWALLNRDFHCAISSASSQGYSIRMLHQIFNISAIQVRSDVLSMAGRRDEAENEHRQILEAARANDVPRVLEILAAHSGVPIRQLRERLQESNSLVDAR